MIKWLQKLFKPQYNEYNYWPHINKQPEHCAYCYGIHGANWDLCPKPTIFAPMPYFSHRDWPEKHIKSGEAARCHWLCTECFERDKKLKQWYIDRYNNTIEGAMLTCAIDEKDGKIKYAGYEPIEADFEVTFESIAPYVTQIIDAAEPWDHDGIGFSAVVIKDDKVLIRYERELWHDGQKTMMEEIHD